MNPQDRQARSWRSWLWTICKVCLALGLLYFLYRQGMIRFSDLGSALERPWLLGEAALCVLGSLPLLGLRWWVLLKGLGVELSLGQVAYVWSVGYLGNFFLPGAASGDALRLAYLAAWAKGQRTHAMLTVVVDRYISLISMFALAVLVLPLRLSEVLADPILKALALAALAISLGGAFLLVLALFFAGPLGSMLEQRHWREGALPRRAFCKLWEALAMYSRSWRPLLANLCSSLVAQSLCLTAMWLVGLAMDNHTLRLLDYFFVGSFATLANVLPITPGGLGVGEGAFAQIARLIAPHTLAEGLASTYLGFRVISFLVSVAGSLACMVIARPAAPPTNGSAMTET